MTNLKPLTDAELDELEALCEAATPGPWANKYWLHDPVPGDAPTVDAKIDGRIRTVCNPWRWLIARVRELKVELRNLKTWKSSYLDDIATCIEHAGIEPLEGKALQMLDQIDVIREERDELKAHVAELEKQNMCDACCGTGKSISNIPCMCGGSGLMSDAALSLRDRVIELEAKLEPMSDEDIDRSVES